jgi:hypothetical protein
MAMLTVIRSFEARWSNYGDAVPQTKQFTAGERYLIDAEKPEGIEVHGFFLFRRYLVNCTIGD